MGDTVQRLLEGMVPELEDLAARGIFSRDELKEVVSRRTDCEYNLKRRAPVKADFWAYAAFEEGLEMERKKRCRRLHREDLEKDRAGVGVDKEGTREARAQRLARQSGGKGPSDHAGPRRIAFIYSRAVRRFKRDLDVHLRYINFCKRNGGTRSAGKAFLGALQMHAGNADLWADAAFWEYEGNLDPGSARSLFQRGLRVVDKEDARDLWVHYFSMEVMYVQKVLERRRVLGLNQTSDAQKAEAGNARGSSDSDEGDGEGDRIDLSALPGREEEEEGDGPSAEKRARRDGAEEVNRAGSAALEAVAKGVVPRIVYKNLCVAYPGEVGPRLKCLDVLLRVEKESAAYEVSCDVSAEIAAEVQSGFPDSASAIAKCALVELRTNGGNVANAVAVFDRAITRQRARETKGAEKAAHIVRRLLCEKAAFLHAFVDECRAIIAERAAQEGRAADDMSAKSDASDGLAATLPLCLRAYAEATDQNALPAARVARRCGLLSELGRVEAAAEVAWEYLSPLTCSSHSQDNSSGSDSDSDSSDDDNEDDRGTSPWSGLVHPVELYASVSLLHTAVSLTEDLGGTVDAADLRRALVRLIKCAERSLVAEGKGRVVEALWDYTEEESREGDGEDGDDEAGMGEEDEDGSDSADIRGEDDNGGKELKRATLVGASNHLWKNLAAFDCHNSPEGSLATAELWLHRKPWANALKEPEARDEVEASIAKHLYADAGVEGFREFAKQLKAYCPEVSLGFYKQAIEIEEEVEVLEASKVRRPIALLGASSASLCPVKVLFMQATGNGGVGALDPALWESWMEWCMRRSDFSGAEQVRTQALRSLATGGGVKRKGAVSTAPLIEEFEERCRSLNARMAAAIRLG